MAKKEEFVSVPGEKLLETIGIVTVKWAALEFLIDNVLFWASDPTDTSTVTLLSSGSIRARWSRLKDILRLEHASHPGTAKLTTLVDLALSIKGERDTIVHGVYADTQQSPSPEKAIAILMKGHKVKAEWPVNRPRALETAQKIDHLVGQFSTHLIAHGERLGNSILPNAWRHKDRR